MHHAVQAASLSAVAEVEDGSRTSFQLFTMQFPVMVLSQCTVFSAWMTRMSGLQRPDSSSATKAQFLCPICKYGALISRRTQDRKRRKANHDDEDQSFKSNLFGCYLGCIPPEPSPNLFGDG